MKQLKIIIFFLFIILTANAQTYPVQVNVYALPPYSKFLSDYYTSSREKLVVSLLNRDQQRPNLEVQLQMTITAANGLKIQSRPEVNYPAITLTEGVMTRLTQNDLEPYFLPQNTTTQGYFDQGKLPDGLVEFTFQAIEKYTRKPLSLPGTARVWLVTEKPPILNLPFNNEFVAFKEPLNIKFQWMPQHKNLSQVEYDFELREIPSSAAAPQSVYLYSPIIYQDRMLYTNLLYGVMMPPLEANKTYGWRVRAIAKDGVDELNMFENNGYSETYFFKTQTNCQSPKSMMATLKDRQLDLNWMPAEGNEKFVLQYRDINGTSAEWIDVEAKQPHAFIYGLKRTATYEYRVGGFCTGSNQPVFTELRQITIPSKDSARVTTCGLMPPIDLSNKETLPSLNVGEVVRLSDYPMTITKISGGDGNFSGEGWVPINWILENKLAVEFSGISVNTDYQLISGTVRAKYDKTESQIADLDVFTEGGASNTRNGIILPDIIFDFILPDNPQFTYSTDTGELMVFDIDGVPQTIELPFNNEGRVVFPMVVKDEEGNLYKLEETTSETEQIAAVVPITSTYLGKQNTPLSTDSFNTQSLTPNTAVVTFIRGNGKYAFDEWQAYYEAVNKIGGKDLYDHLATSGSAYNVPWKLLPQGESDEIKAKIEIQDSKLNPEKVIFSTPQGTEYKYTYDKKDKTYTLSLMVGQDSDVQEIYALYPTTGDKYHTLGKLNVVTYKKQSPKVVIVSVNEYSIDTNNLKQELDKIYLPVGVNWQVSSDNFSYHIDNSFFDKGSGLLTAYNDKMAALQSAYKETKGSIEKDACYIFVLNYSGDDNNRNTAGFMPRGKQFGYIFLSNIEANKVNNVVAHELGHGLWKLRHTFDDSYGKTAQATEGTTNNLMDYNNGIALAKWQWDQLREPAVFDGWFDGDEEGMARKDEVLRIINELRTANTNDSYAKINLRATQTVKSYGIKINDYELKMIEIQPYSYKVDSMKIKTMDKSTWQRNGSYKTWHTIQINGNLVIYLESEQDRDSLYNHIYLKKDNFLPWMNYVIAEAKTMNGVSECNEPLNSKGKEYHQHGGHNNFCVCGKKGHVNYCNPSAWCASFANWCLRESKVAYTKSAGSQTFLSNTEFVQIYEPAFGAIAVFTNLDGYGNFRTSGHVAFVVGKIGKNEILCLGGNQADMIKVSSYSLEKKKDKKKNQLYFRGYYIPKTYSDKLENYKTEIKTYSDSKVANQEIIKLNIDTQKNESTR